MPVNVTSISISYCSFSCSFFCFRQNQQQRIKYFSSFYMSHLRQRHPCIFVSFLSKHEKFDGDVKLNQMNLVQLNQISNVILFFCNLSRYSYLEYFCFVTKIWNIVLKKKLFRFQFQHHIPSFMRKKQHKFIFLFIPTYRKQVIWKHFL